MAMMVLITGVKGFIGHHLYGYLMDEGYDVKGIDDCSGLGWEDRDVPHTHCDITKDPAPFIDAKFVIHLAARAGVRNSWDPDQLKDYSDVNIKGTSRIFNSYRNSKILYASSSSVYDVKSPYAMSKVACEHMAPTNAVGMRFFTVYGERSRPDMFYRKLKEGKIKYLTKHTRDWSHVDEVCSGIHYMMKNFDVLKLKRHAVYDIGKGMPISVYDFAKRHAPDNVDVDALPFKDVVGESENTCADSTPLKELGWNAV